MIIHVNEQMMSFSEYCLSESIKPAEISYGINHAMDDQDIKQSDKHAYTFFKFDDLYYSVTFLKKTMEVGFGVSEQHSLDPNKYVDDRTQTRRALRVYGHVMFVLFEILDFYKPPYIKFDSANPAVGKVYDRMVDNKFIMNYINQNGYIYEGQHKGTHIFKRK